MNEPVKPLEFEDELDDDSPIDPLGDAAFEDEEEKYEFE